MLRTILWLTLLLLAFPIIGSAQTVFRAGYLIDEAGERRSVLIRDRDWRYNPDNFRYRTPGDEVTYTADLSNVREFGTDDGKSRYVRAAVDIDQSSSDPKSLSVSDQPEFIRQTVFLRQLVDGEADLYHYEENGRIRFFYRLGADTIQPLIARKYIFRDGVQATGRTRIRETNTFRSQLSRTMQCDNTQQKIFTNLGYTPRELVRFFEAYNSCRGVEQATYYAERKARLGLGVVLGLDRAGFARERGGQLNKDNLSFGLGLRAGLDLEVYPPINNGKWAALLQVVYQHYENTDEDLTIYNRLRYAAVTTSLGVRHYFFLSEQSALFLNGLFSYNTPLNASFATVRDDGLAVGDALELGRSGGFSVGGGLRFADHYRVEFRYNLPFIIAPDFTNFSAVYEGVGILATYTF